MKNLSKIFTTIIEIVKFVIAKEAKNVTIRRRINYQIDEKIKHVKNRDKQLQKQNDSSINFKGILRSYVELENKLNAMEEKFTKYDSENN